MSLPYLWTPVAERLAVVVRVTPRGGRDAAEGLAHDVEARPHLKLRVASAPVDEETNDVVENLLATLLGLAPSAVKVTSGETARPRRVHVNGDPVHLARRAQARLAPEGKP